MTIFSLKEMAIGGAFALFAVTILVGAVVFAAFLAPPFIWVVLQLSDLQVWSTLNGALDSWWHWWLPL